MSFLDVTPTNSTEGELVENNISICVIEVQTFALTELGADTPEVFRQIATPTTSNLVNRLAIEVGQNLRSQLCNTNSCFFLHVGDSRSSLPLLQSQLQSTRGACA